MPPLPPLADPAALVRAMAKAHTRLVADLRARAGDPRVEPALRAAHAADRAEGKTGEPYETYRDAFCDQVGASWVLCTVFARTLEDRGYLPHRLAGPGAGDKLAQFRTMFRFLGERDYLLHVFDGVSLLPGGREVFGHGFAPLWKLAPTSRALGELLDELRAEDGGVLRFSFGRGDGDRDRDRDRDRDGDGAGAVEDHDGASTRYLGDLYQDLNEGVRKRYALLQTPEFVERFLLENTLDPAVRERGVAVTVLDPACGSGHMLLGAYDRLFEARRRIEPGLPREESARAALGQVYGVDLNPYAAAVARFRLLLSFLDKAGIPRLENVPSGLEVQVYVGDSLLAGLGELQAGIGDLFARQGIKTDLQKSAFSFFSEEADKVLRKRFDVVVANPPYITEKDDEKRGLIRKHYKSASGGFSLAAPFVERIFQLGNAGGWNGQITANSFMKRDFGKRLVEEILPGVDLGAVLDASGAYIPGHGTPTVILFGRARRPASPLVRVAMGIRGEPTPPAVPAEGLVWLSIARHHDDPSFKNGFISVVDLERTKLARHPWSLGGGGAAGLKDLLEERADRLLGEVVTTIGRTTVAGEDEVWISRAGYWKNLNLGQNAVPLVVGDCVRDWTFAALPEVLYPYSELGGGTVPEDNAVVRALWSWRVWLENRTVFGKQIKQHGRPWWEHLEHYTDRLRTPMSIACAFIATHAHFVMSDGGRVFNRTAPAIKLAPEATHEQHHALLSLLNSSTACFWMKQACFDRGNRGGERGTPAEEWERFFEFAVGPLCGLPLVSEALDGASPLADLGRDLTALGEQWAASDLTRTLDAILDAHPDNLQHGIALALAARLDLESRIRALQERLDWLVYAAFGLCSPDLAEGDVDRRGPAERVSDLLYARKILDEQGSRRYFQLCRLPAPEIVAAQPLSDLDERRLAAIEASPWLKLLEQPAYKRTYRESFRPTDIEDVCQTWLLDRTETTFREALSDPRPLSIRALAAALTKDPKVRAVAELLTATPNFDLENLLGDLLQKESVASAKSQRYTDAGLEKRAAWERVWDLQRREDAGEKLTIDPPPKYDQKDFESAATVWRLRGKLDVPKERFLAYPTATPPSGAAGTRAALVFGWAGWDHLQQIQATIQLWQDEMGLHGHELLPRATRKEIEDAPRTRDLEQRLQLDAAARDRLFPLLQTMADLLPWIRQWHDDDGETAPAFEAYLTEQALRLDTTLDEARAYRRPARTKRPQAPKSGTRDRQGADPAPAPKPPKSGSRDRQGADPAPAPKPPLDEEALLDAVRALDQGAGAPVADLPDRLGASPAAVKKVVDALVEAGRLVEKKKRPRLVAVAG